MCGCICACRIIHTYARSEIYVIITFFSTFQQNSLTKICAHKVMILKEREKNACAANRHQLCAVHISHSLFLFHSMCLYWCVGAQTKTHQRNKLLSKLFPLTPNGIGNSDPNRNGGECVCAVQKIYILLLLEIN